MLFFFFFLIGILSPNEKIQTDDFHHIAKKTNKTKKSHNKQTWSCSERLRANDMLAGCFLRSNDSTLVCGQCVLRSERKLKENSQNKKNKKNQKPSDEMPRKLPQLTSDCRSIHFLIETHN